MHTDLLQKKLFLELESHLHALIDVERSINIIILDCNDVITYLFVLYHFYQKIY